MPQLNPMDWAPQLVWLVLTFGVLYLLMKHVALPKIGSVIEMRQARIRGDLEAADKLRRETQEAIAAYEQALAEAKNKAHAIAQEGRAQLNAEIAAEREKLEKELGVKQAQAEASIEAAKSAALKEVNTVAADTAAAIVQRLIGIAPSKPETAAAVEAARKG
jgi:F-type H+-transporting ATPase subunit b